MKHLFFAFSIAALFISLFQPNSYVQNIPPNPDSTSVTISFVGDLMCHSPQFEYAQVGKDTFDFNPVFQEVKELLSSSHLTIGNFETVALGKGSNYSGYPLFNTPVDYISALKNNGFDLLITSNNHSLDQGTKGIENTLENIRSYGLKTLGTYKSNRERDSSVIIEINNIKIGLCAFTYGLNGNYLPKQNNYMVNVIDTIEIKKSINNLRLNGAELVIAYFHFGDEYKRESNKYQKDIASFAVNCGAEIIIGSHPHVIQEGKYITPVNSKLDKGFIAYSLGNFISNQRWRYSDSGVILNFTITKSLKEDKLKLAQLSIDPLWLFKGKTSDGNLYILIPSDTSSSKSFKKYLNSQEIEKLHQSFLDTKEVLKDLIK